jgi:hypothetical protein
MMRLRCCRSEVGDAREGLVQERRHLSRRVRAVGQRVSPRVARQQGLRCQ